MISYWFSPKTTNSSWRGLRSEIELELEDYNLSYNNNKNCSRKQEKKRENFKKRKHLTEKVKQRIIPQDDRVQDVDSAILEAIIWGDQYLRHTLSQTYGNKRKNSPKTRSRIVKQRQGFQVPIPEWSWADVYGTRVVHDQQVEHRNQRRIVL